MVRTVILMTVTAMMHGSSDDSSGGSSDDNSGDSNDGINADSRAQGSPPSRILFVHRLASGVDQQWK